MIAIFLVGLCALPLAQFPMQAIQEEMKSAFRMEIPRLADLAFAEIKEKLYQQKIPWEEIANTRGKKVVVMDDIIEISFDPLGSKKFKRLGTLHSVGKKGPKGEQWRLVTFQVAFQPTQKNLKLFRGKQNLKKFTAFTYQVLLTQAPLITTPILPESAPKIERELQN